MPTRCCGKCRGTGRVSFTVMGGIEHGEVKDSLCSRCGGSGEVLRPKCEKTTKETECACGCGAHQPCGDVDCPHERGWVK